MFKLIRRIQQKPESSRRRTTILSALFITFIIAIIWFSTLSSRFGDVSSENQKKPQAPSPLTSFSSSMESIKGLFSQTYESVQTDMQDVSNTSISTSSATGTTISTTSVATTSSSTENLSTTTGN